MNALPRFAGVAIFTLALSMLVVEVALTRVFSVMTYYHFTYLIIGLALLGFGAAGTVLTVHPRFAGDRVDSDLFANCAWLFGLTLMICFLWITKTSFEVLAVYYHRDLTQLFSLLIFMVLASVPFFFGGLCLGYLISKSGDQINRLYFLDLTGAGFGSLGALFAINYLGAPSTIFWVAVAACSVATLVGGRVDGRIRWRYPLTGVAALALALLSAWDDGTVPVPFPRSKNVDTYATEHRWHVVARVDVTPPRAGYPSFGGCLSRLYDEPRERLEYRSVYQDGFAPTGIINLQDRDLKEVEIFGYYLQAIPYVIRPDANALVIGPGGGIDVAIALHHGSEHVTAVEINPWTIDYVQNVHNEYAGGLYRRPDVNVVLAEGRHFLTASDEKFDVIQLSGVDTYSALASGAFALSESYLYTREAVSDMLDHLTPEGVLSYSRWLFSPPRETLRLVVTARVALQLRGVNDPQRHIMVLSGYRAEEPPWAETLIKLEPFTAAEVAALRRWTDRLKFDVLYDPLLPYAPGTPYDELPTTAEFDPSLSVPHFDAALRSSPGEFERFVDEYFYAIEPSVDDSPFFFNFYRSRSLLQPFQRTKGGYGLLRFPLGLAVLIGCLIQVLILGGLFILLPMRGRLAPVADSPALVGVLTYFACIGLAFITVEIMLLQKLTVFLGGPVYSMAVTLFSLLVFCGIGSYLARRLTVANLRGGAAGILGGVVVAVLVTTAVLDVALPSLMWLSHPLRCVMAILILLPLGLLMGMPFPTGIRMAEQLDVRIVPWAWCVNACATVAGSIASILVAMFFGFTIVVWGASAVYLVALLTAWRTVAAPVQDPG